MLIAQKLASLPFVFPSEFLFHMNPRRWGDTVEKYDLFTRPWKDWLWTELAEVMYRPRASTIMKADFMFQKEEVPA